MLSKVRNFDGYSKIIACSVFTKELFPVYVKLKRLIYLFCVFLLISCAREKDNKNAQDKSIRISDKFVEYFQFSDSLFLKDTKMIADLEVGVDDLIYIADPLDGNIKKYLYDGTLYQIIGRKGRGPGEFENPKGLFLNDGYVYVAELRGRVTVIDTSGKYVRSFVSNSHMCSDIIKVGDKIVVSGLKQSAADKGYFLNLYDERGRFLNSFFEISEKYKSNVDLLTFAWVSFDVDSVGNIYAVQQVDYKIYKLSPEGQILKVYRYNPSYYISPSVDSHPKGQNIKAIEQWEMGWHQIIKILVVNKYIFVQVKIHSPTKYMLDIYNLDGKVIVSGIPTNFRMLGADRKGLIYFEVDHLENGVVLYRYKFRGD